jgi:hypothetical protein
VTNYDLGEGAGALSNWDTGLEVANTTSDPFSSVVTANPLGAPGGATPQNGSCTFYFYNAGTYVGSETQYVPTEATPAATYTTPVLYSGGTYGVMASTAAPGITGGYAIAVCDFTNGVGFAEVVDNANGLGDWGVMGSYVPYVIPSPWLYSRSLAGSAFIGIGEFAIP